MKNTTLHFATAQDMPAVLGLIQDLAEYENAPQEVTLTLPQLIEDGFTHKLFTCIVAKQNNEVVGMALFYQRYSTWKGKTLHLEDFIVKQEFRQQNIGQKLFEAVVAEANKMGANRMEWAVLNWNTPAINFYSKIGANIDKDWYIGQLTRQQITSFETLKNTKK